MATGLVIGIFSKPDAKALEDALSGQQIDLTKVKVFSIGDGDADDSDIHFVDVINVEATSFDDEIMRGTGVIADSGGTSVPGLAEDDEPRYDSFVVPETSAHYLEGYAIPDDEVDNYDDAIAEGRAVVLYPDCGPEAPKIATAFAAAGLLHVRSY